METVLCGDAVNSFVVLIVAPVGQFLVGTRHTLFPLLLNNIIQEGLLALYGQFVVLPCKNVYVFTHVLLRQFRYKVALHRLADGSLPKVVAI